MKLKLIFLLTVFIISIFTYSNVQAQTASPSSDLEQKIKTLQEEIASKAASLKDQISKQLTNKAYIGKISQITGSQINVQTFKDIKNINTNNFTIYTSEITVKKEPLALDGLTSGDYIAALGDTDANGLLSAKKITLLDPTDFTPRQAIMGELVFKNSNSMEIKASDLKLKKILLDQNSNFQISDNSVNERDINLNSLVLVVAFSTLDQPDVLTARTVYEIPGGHLDTNKTQPSQKGSSSSASGE